MIRLAKADAGVVRVLTSDGQHLRMVASRGLPAQVVKFERLVSRDCGQCGIAIGQNKPCFEIDLAGCADRTHSDWFGTNCQAMVVVPLQNAGRLLGTYNLYLPQAFELPEEVALLFRSIGEHLGMALENSAPEAREPAHRAHQRAPDDGRRDPRLAGADPGLHEDAHGHAERRHRRPVNWSKTPSMPATSARRWTTPTATCASCWCSSAAGWTRWASTTLQGLAAASASAPASSCITTTASPTCAWSRRRKARCSTSCRRRWPTSRAIPAPPRRI
jgi:hypothetical protein